MKRITYLKTLLVGLCAMVATSAWAETSTLLNYEGPWTHTHDGGTGARSAYYDFGVNGSIDDNWTASFDVTITTGSTWTNASDFQIAITKDGTSYTNNTVVGVANIIFGARVATTRSNMGSDLACTITLNGTDVEGTTTLSHGIKYTFKISVEGTALAASIMNGNTEVYSGIASLDAYVNPRGIYDLLPRPYNASWGVYSDTYEQIKLTKEVAEGSVDVPSASITAVDGINRTVTFKCPTDNVSFSYSINNGTSWTNGDYVVISENTDIIVKATKGANSAQSDVLSFQAGTEITLNTPIWAKTGYTDGVSTVTLTDNQSNILLNPVTTIKYKINDGDAQTYSEAFTVNDGETMKYWSEATGYTNSSEGSVTAIAPCTDPTIFTETYNGNNAAITVNTEDVVTTIGGSSTPYYYMIANDTHVSDYLISSTKAATNWLLRSTGIYSGNTMNYALTNVQKNDIVTITIVWGTEYPVPTSNDGTLDLWNSVSGNTYVFKVTSTMGNFRFTLGRYASVKSVSVQRGTITATIGSNGFATFASSCNVAIPSDVIAYTAKLNDENNAVKFIKIEESTIPANHGVLLEGIPNAKITLNVVTSAEAIGENDFIAGSGVAPSDNTKTYYAMVKDSAPLTFGKIADNVAIPANKAYLAVSNSDATRLTVTFDGETTAIKSIENAETNNAIYNLNGQRVSKAQKGLYIVNGKKTIVK